MTPIYGLILVVLISAAANQAWVGAINTSFKWLYVVVFSVAAYRALQRHGSDRVFRALEPLEGLDHMRARRGVQAIRQLCSGPGKLTEALGIGLDYNDTDLLTGPVVFSPRPRAWRDVEIAVDTRIGITKAPELPWRFSAEGNRFVSKPVRPTAAV